MEKLQDGGSFDRASEPGLRQQKPQKDFVSVSAMLRKLVLEAVFQAKVHAVGSYGYMVSRGGARNLLAMMHARKICMGVDYAMIFNSLSAEDVTAFRDILPDDLPWNLRYFIQETQLHESKDVPVVLNSYIYTPVALVYHKDFPSSINHTVWKGIDVFDS